MPSTVVGNLPGIRQGQLIRSVTVRCPSTQIFTSILLKLALHELDPVFRNATLENDRLKALVRDLRFHHDPVGKDYV